MKIVAALAEGGMPPALPEPHIVLAADAQQRLPGSPADAEARPARGAGLVCAWPRNEAERAAVEAALAPHAASLHRVHEVVHWDELGADAAAAWVVVYFVYRRPDLSPEAFAAHYRGRHAPLARIHHPGIARYVQNFALDGAAGGPDAIAELWFARERDGRERFYRDEASRRAIGEDVRRFVDLGAGSAFTARVRAAPGPRRSGGLRGSGC